MNNDHTIRLLRECSAGTEMGIASIEEALPGVRDQKLRSLLEHSRDAHTRIGQEAEQMLKSRGGEVKEPGAIARGMSFAKTNLKLAFSPGDASVADLITDGCHMGVKSLRQTLNDCSSADSSATQLAERLIEEEDRLASDLREYL